MFGGHSLKIGDLYRDGSYTSCIGAFVDSYFAYCTMLLGKIVIRVLVKGIHLVSQAHTQEQMEVDPETFVQSGLKHRTRAKKEADDDFEEDLGETDEEIDAYRQAYVQGMQRTIQVCFKVGRRVSI